MNWKVWDRRNLQDICLLAETNKVSDERLEAGTVDVDSPETAESWGLDSNQQCKDELTGRYIQFVSTLSCDPIPIYRSNMGGATKTDTTIVAQLTEDKEMVFLETKSSKAGMVLWVGICLALLTLTLCVIVLAVVFT